MSGIPEPIAIIGTGCRFPGDSNTPSKLWELLQRPTDLLTTIPNERFNIDGFYHQYGQYHGHGNIRQAYLLSGETTFKRFDAQFFGISPAEANVLDPQIRLLLETVYEALENAGQTIEGLQGSDTAIYVGTMLSEYERLMLRDEDTMEIYHAVGTARAMVSNRVSYFFNWHGPSMTIDTACSSSLVAVHQAIQQLRLGQSRVAIAAGASLILDPQGFISFSKLKMLSPDSRSQMWDASANGYARGEGIAAVVLKTLSAAEADGDHIECIIREVGVNQDGRTLGLTMPSASAQASLIRDCYARAGLDLDNPVDHPQFFEAHGTGTPAGDPVEAEAINTAFFAGQSNAVQDSSNKICVGSIKSVIGHTEGTAGIAALLKASLAIQNATIPPNLHFNHLNPKIEPFYTHLRVPTSPLPWPSNSSIRRASVNSFGFGGTNAHVILEQYKRPSESIHENTNSSAFTPFVFSAASGKSLYVYLATLSAFLRGASDMAMSLRDLAYTLYSRRSHLQIGITIAASNVNDLCNKIEEEIEHSRVNRNQELGRRPLPQSSPTKRPCILGIFTGQGAQWARMGAELVETSDTARRVIESLERRLSQLPDEDRPSWSLLEELQKDDSMSQINHAELSQPLCTAIQILQVDMLHAAGIEFSAVVGHSSGEIGAAYAAGFISAGDAICIAYYRGVCSRLAQEQPGAMMAVESTVEDIQELCQSRHFKGRVNIAAINSPTSQTVSGNKDSILKLQAILQDENKFAKILKVDKAYHSHHMNACSEKYLSALSALDIKAKTEGKCVWVSSVHQGRERAWDNEILQGKYWNENLVRPVLFMEAIRSAWTSQGPFDLAIEVGPHPALKNSVLQTINNISGQEIPYTALFHRTRNPIQTVADSLGFLWSHLGKGHVNFHAYDIFISGTRAPPCRLIKGLPTYAWNHENEYWYESRYARAERQRSDPVHQLLGHITPNSTERETRWRNILRSEEIPWLKGHCLQGQIVFPAAGYVVLALEAALRVCKHIPVSIVEISDLELGKALTFDQSDTNVEAVFSLTGIQETGDKVIDANFTYSAAEKSSDSLTLRAGGSIRIWLGENSTTVLPPKGPQPSNSLEIPSDYFYDSLGKLNYQYSGPFKALTNLKRRLGYATGSISNLDTTEMLLHPAILDAAFQSTFLARSAPFDGSIWAMHVPKSIRKVRINPVLCASQAAKLEALSFISVQPVDSCILMGDVDIYPMFSENAMIQVEGLECIPFSSQSAKDDKGVFSTTIWDVANPDAEKVAQDFAVTTEQRALAHLLERVSIFYLRNLKKTVPNNHFSRSKGPLSYLFKFASHCISLADKGKLPFWKAEWDYDTYEQISLACESYADVIDIKLLRRFGDNLVAIATGEKKAIEVGTRDNLLAEFYQDSLGMDTYTRFLAKTVRQIVHRYPHLNVLEIGAGTGGATKAIFQEIGQAYASYTFTDVSSGFFPMSQKVFEPQHGMAFKVLNINNDPRTQGFEGQPYDLIIASMVLHATEYLEGTLRNVRRLLKPGGYLVLLEGLPDTNVRYGTIFGAFPGWWAGSKHERVLSPLVSIADWHELLCKTGFSGVDSATPNPEPLVAPLTAIVSQAVDDRILLLRDPLSSQQQLFATQNLVEDLIIVGGSSPHMSKATDQIEGVLRQYYGRLTKVPSFTAISTVDMSDRTTILALNELDGPFFKSLDESSWEALRETLARAKTILWVTHSRLSESPHGNMIIGLLRTASREIPTLDVQFLDFADYRKVNHHIIAETLLRLEVATLWKRKYPQEDLLFSVESEIVLNDKQQAKIPRLMINQKMNQRYNSSRRPVSMSVSKDDQAISVAYEDSRYFLQQRQSLVSDRRTGVLNVTHSLLSALKVAESGYMFLKLGKKCDSGDLTVFLSTEFSSVTNAWDNFEIPIEIEPDLEANFLSHVAHHLLISLVLKGLTKGKRVLVLEGGLEYMSVMKWRARNIDVDVTFMTYNTKSIDPNCLVVHPNAAERDLRSLLPRDVSVFVDFTGPGSDQMRGDRIRSQLPAHCRCERSGTLFSKVSCIPWTSHSNEIRTRLQDAVNYAYYSLSEKELPRLGVPTTGVGSLSECGNELSPQSIIDWTTSQKLSVQVQSVNTQMAFSECNTYWLVGLTHGLGLSLAEWMVRHGAKYIVLSSRRPIVDESWLAKMFAAGAVIKIFKCDITNEGEVIKTHTEICSSLPPIRGVAQGAMVLDDISISEMTITQLLKVTRPKVEGSVHLHNLFLNNTLDFFVFFSSVSSVIGYSGQSNYAAANLFMLGLAEKRHQRGLAASVINIGPILGVGYISQRGINLRSRIEAEEAMFISEQDFHQLFAEAIIAGRPGQQGPIEITTGLTRIGLHDEVKPGWALNPILSHYIRNNNTVELAANNTKVNVPIKTRLSQASSRDEVFDVIKDAFISKLSALYQLDIDVLSKEDPSNLKLNEMGTDSLLATEIRGWFMKTFQVNVPVLKILNGTTVRELLTIATETVPLAWIPRVSPENVSLSAHSTHLVHSNPKIQKEELEIKSCDLDPSTDYEKDSDTQYNDVYFQNETQPSSFASEVETDFNDEDNLNNHAEFSLPSFEKTSKLSFSQEMFWFVLTFLRDKSSLNHTASFRLTGNFQQKDFEYALQSVVKQHEILRACFFEQDGQSMLGFLESNTIRSEYREIHDEKEVARVVNELETRCFDISSGDTLRVILLSLSPMTHFLILSSHGLVVDGFSFQIFLRDLQKFYKQAGHKHDSPQYLGYAMKQRIDYENGNYGDELRFWKGEFSDFPDPLPIFSLGKVTTRPTLTTYENERANLRLGAEAKDRIRVFCHKYGVTPFHFHLTVFRALITRYTDAEDVSIGIADANRHSEDMMNSIGPFVNLLPLRFHTKGSAIFDSLLKETRSKVLDALTNAKVPFQVLLNELGAPRSASCTPIFQCFVDYRLGQREKTAWADCQLEMLSFQVSRLAYDVTLDITDNLDGDCLCMLIVRKDLYSQRDAEILLKSYEQLVDAFTTHPTMTLDEPQIFGSSEIEKAISFSQGRFQRRLWPETIIHRIDDVSEIQPDRPAVKWDGNNVATYSEIRNRINTIADSLSTANISVGSRVAILQTPTADSIASILAIMRLGAVYIPLDLGNSWNRLASMAQDCRPSLVLVDNDTEQDVEKLCVRALTAINVSSLPTKRVPSWPIAATAYCTATILYTSGSSGAPKGVVLNHKGFRNWLESTAEIYDLESEVVLQQSSSGFDMSLIQIFTALCLGGSMYLVPRRLRGDPQAISKLIHTHNITYTCTCTSELFTWLRYGSHELLSRSSWRRAITGGEPGVDSLFKDFTSLRKRDLRLFHIYGPTEISWTATTTELFYSTLQDESTHQNITVGHPLPNYSVYVLDGRLNPVPPGIQGEIYVGGPGVAVGYLNDDALTSERFVPDIFATPNQRHRGWNTLHRTGDVGRWEQDGTLFIEGRISGDTQIKLRGIRIDLKEVEKALIRESQGTLSEAVVSVRRSSPDSPQSLVAHVVFDRNRPRGGRAQTLDTLKSRLGLPRYMCPSAIVPLDNMPRTKNLKLDRRAIATLPLPEVTNMHNVKLTETESQLKAIWTDVISNKITDLHKIEPATDFFHVGGTSLLLLDLQRRIERYFHVQLQLISMFSTSTLAGMSLMIENNDKQQPPTTPISWDQETDLPQALRQLVKTPLVNYSDSKIVVLTGSTGYLGQGILDALVKDPSVKKIHCIAVREANKRPRNLDSKIIVYEGDLVLPHLGLTDRDVREIFDTANLIIHNGADVSYMKAYTSLRLSNLQATKELAEMGMHRMIPFHYISSGGACSFAAAAGSQRLGPTSVAQFPPPSDSPPGYASSKWASEVFLEKLNAQHMSWSICIHRPSNIARIDTPQLDLVYNIQHYSRQLQAVPITRGKAHGTLDSVPLDTVVQGIVQATKDTPHNTLRFLHHLGGIKFPINDLRSWAVDNGCASAEYMDDGKQQAEIQEIPLHQWTASAAEQGMHPALVAFLQTFPVQGGLVFPQLIKDGDDH